MVPRVDGSTTGMKKHLLEAHNMYAPQCMHDTYTSTCHMHAVILSFCNSQHHDYIRICMKSLCSEEPAMKSMHIFW